MGNVILKGETFDEHRILDLEQTEAAVSDFPRVIRRDLPDAPTIKPRVVPWIGHKIEKAVDSACTAIGHEPVGKQIQAEVEFRMKKERPLFIHIEQLQDLVEDLLIELGYGHVALAYGNYRAPPLRAARDRKPRSPAASRSSSSSPPPALLNDLRARLSFARIGLDLSLSESELIARLHAQRFALAHAAGTARDHHPQREEPARCRRATAASSPAAFSSPISTRRRCRGKSPTASTSSRKRIARRS